ncbi:RNA polymerase sigma factor (sigma-70 family) [Catalinimonas alkaloidigena]|uniref:RNA polymerase sigma factor n=1 Tax=Catalinimonas alkaloidigena TaxID=1075417 RepID=UPI002404D7D3|nr:sigma-70 family RNA polymerase sigma factor [Catalinimonas alkaloidigena]MDF9798802.1 RNA polymerase sigma factor (sigma-70 family) [Catalinimonas alkaloidigena]
MPDLSHTNLGDLNQWTDEALWEEFKNGNHQAFHCIYKQYSSQLYNYGRQICKQHDQVKDAMQDLFVSLWQNKESLGKTTAIKFYLFTALRRRIIENEEKYTKAAIRQYRYQEASTVKLVTPFDHDLIQQESIQLQKQCLERALESLSPQQKEVTFLLYYHNMKYKAIAGLMGITTRSVYTLAWKAAKTLKKKVKQLKPLLLTIFLTLYVVV